MIKSTLAVAGALLVIVAIPIMVATRSGTAITIGVNSASLTDNTAALATSIYQTLHELGLS
jgi:hypothetical protein